MSDEKPKCDIDFFGKNKRCETHNRVFSVNYPCPGPVIATPKKSSMDCPDCGILVVDGERRCWNCKRDIQIYFRVAALEERLRVLESAGITIPRTDDAAGGSPEKKG